MHIIWINVPNVTQIWGPPAVILRQIITLQYDINFIPVSRQYDILSPFIMMNINIAI